MGCTAGTQSPAASHAEKAPLPSASSHASPTTVATTTTAAAATTTAAPSPGIQVTYAMIKPDAVAAGHAAAILQKATEDGFSVKQAKVLRLTQDIAKTFYEEHTGKPFFETLVNFMTSGEVVALALERDNAILRWRELIGPTNSTVAKAEKPNSIRGLFGTDGTKNAAHGSDKPESAAREISLIFGPAPAVEQTYAMIKPDCVGAGHVDAIIKRIEEAGFVIAQRKQFKMSQELANKFYAEHIGKSFFPNLTELMTSGDSVGLRLERTNAILGWRELLGPTTNAKTVAPDTIRGKFATDNTRNAAHGSDSAASAIRELALIFLSQ